MNNRPALEVTGLLESSWQNQSGRKLKYVKIEKFRELQGQFGNELRIRTWETGNEK